MKCPAVARDGTQDTCLHVTQRVPQYLWCDKLNTTAILSEFGIVTSRSDKQLAGSHSYIMHYCDKRYFWSTLFHSLGWNKIGDSGASALADALKSEPELKNTEVTTK